MLKFLTRRRFSSQNMLAQFNDFIETKDPDRNDAILLSNKQFENYVDKITNKEDVKETIEIYLQFIGWKNKIKQSILDKFVIKALEVDGFEEILTLVEHHAELLYFPTESVTEQLFDHAKGKGYEQVKQLHQAIERRPFVPKPMWYASDIIEAAYAEGDKDTILSCYCEIMDYEDSGLKEDSVWKVLDSFNYEKGIDRFLFAHIKEFAKKHKFNASPNFKLAVATF